MDWNEVNAKAEGMVGYGMELAAIMAMLDKKMNTVKPI